MDARLCSTQSDWFGPIDSGSIEPILFSAASAGVFFVKNLEEIQCRAQKLVAAVRRKHVLRDRCAASRQRLGVYKLLLLNRHAGDARGRKCLTDHNEAGVIPAIVRHSASSGD